MTVQIRAATPADAESAAVVHVRSTQVAYAPFGDPAFLAKLSVADRTAQNIQSFTQGPETGRRYWIAESDGRAIGISYTGPSRDADGTASTGEIYTVYLDPDWWGTGAGRRLFEHAVADLLARGFAPLTLWVLEKNARARRFYEIAEWTLDEGSATFVPGQEAAAKPLFEVRYRLTYSPATSA